MKNYYQNHEWVSASLLKVFAKSPAKAKAAMEEEQVKSEALLLGTALHHLMESSSKQQRFCFNLLRIHSGLCLGWGFCKHF